MVFWSEERGIRFEVCVCVCMYACVCVGMYVCMYVCMHVCIHINKLLVQGPI